MFVGAMVLSGWPTCMTILVKSRLVYFLGNYKWWRCRPAAPASYWLKVFRVGLVHVAGGSGDEIGRVIPGGTRVLGTGTRPLR